MSNIDFIPSDVIQVLLNAKITFLQGGATDFQNKHLAPGLIVYNMPVS